MNVSTELTGQKREIVLSNLAIDRESGNDREIRRELGPERMRPKERLAGLSPTCSLSPRILVLKGRQWPSLCQCGARIWTLKQLINAAQWKRAVIGNSTFVTRPRPAAFIVSMQARIVYKLLQDGLWFYKPIRPTKGVKT